MADFDSVGRPVKPPPGAALAHEYEVFGTGEKVVVARDAKGCFLRGHRMAETRDPSKLGRSIVDPASVTRRALGLPSHWRKSK